jgi:hypothetical protein
MNRLSLPLPPLLLLMAFSLFAQEPNSDRLLGLLKSVASLPVDRSDLHVNPPMTLEGISAVAADQRGNIYVIHRPADGDPIVVLDPKGNFIRS